MPTLKEAAADVLHGNVKKKKGQADKAERLPGEVQDLGKAVVEPDESEGPDASVGVKKDSSKSSTTKVKGEGRKKSQSLKGDMQEEEELDEDILDEDGNPIDDDPELNEAYDEDDDEDLEENWEIDVPSIDDIELDLSEDIAAMFGEGDFSDDFMERVSTVFEAAVRANVKRYENDLKEAFEEALDDTVVSIQESLESDVSDYLEYVAESWVAENEVAIESGVRNEISEDFINGLKNLFTEHYIDIPDDKVDVVEELSEKIAELKEELDEQIEVNVEMNSVIKEHVKAEAFYTVAEGLTETQTEKLRTLAEEIDFKDYESFTKKLENVKESYFSKKTGGSSARQLDEEVIQNPELGKVEDMSGRMAAYSSMLKKTRAE